MSEIFIKQNLAAAYQIFAYMGLDNWTYTHLSARLPGHDTFFIYPLGLMFEEVTHSSLLKVTLDGEVLEGKKESYNPTGYAIHSTIYKNRPDINAVFHLHTTAGTAVSCMECGLLPISQFAFHFYNHLSYHDYNSLAHTPDTSLQKVADDLGSNKTLFLKNHGTVTCGSTIAEAFFYSHHLEEACKVQCAVLSSNQKIVIPDHHICEKAYQDLHNFEKNIGERDWKAVLRLLKRKLRYEFLSKSAA